MINTGFKARMQAITFLMAQLGDKRALKSLAIKSIDGFTSGIYGNDLRAKEIEEFAKNPPYDEFGMLPYLDELIGVDWVMDFNRFQNICDEEGKVIKAFDYLIDTGKLKEPRDMDTTDEDRDKFADYIGGMKKKNGKNYGLDKPNDWSQFDVDVYISNLLLYANLAALTPPQGYTNAPFYYLPALIDYHYENNYLDANKDTRIPAIHRYNFPETLRIKILDYAKEHNID